MESKFGVVNFVVHVFLKAVVSSVHPSDVGVALVVHADGGVERIGVVNGDTGIVDNDEVAVSTGAGVFGVVAARRGVAREAGSEAGVVVHLGVGVKNGHVDLTRVVGGDVNHGFDEQRHLVVAGSRGELVGLATGIGVGQGVARAVSGLGRNNAVGALNEVHEVRLDVASATVALPVQADGDHASQQTVVVCLLNGGFVIGLLRRVAVLGSFVRDGNHDLGGVGVPAVVGLRWGVTRHVAGSVLPRKASPVGTWSPVLAGVAGIGVPVVDGPGQLANTAGIVAGGLAEWRGARTGVLVVALTVAGAGCAGEGVSKAVDGLVDGHVPFFEHGLDALEVGSACEVSTVNDGADIGPLRVH